MKTILLTALFISLAAVVYSDEGLVACTMEFIPECGADGVTYSNECLRKSAGVEKEKDGACRDKRDDDEDDTLIVVVATDPPATEAPATVAPTTEAPTTEAAPETTSAAPEPTTTEDPNQCSFSLSPICGEDGVTYPTECIMKASGVQMASKGRCPVRKRRQALCKCPKIMRPVVGSDGTVYDNECEAKCAGDDNSKPFVVSRR